MGKEITHFKGGQYKVIGISMFCTANIKHEDLDGAIVYTYQSLDTEAEDYLEVYTRPISELFDTMDFTRNYAYYVSSRFTINK